MSTQVVNFRCDREDYKKYQVNSSWMYFLSVFMQKNILYWTENEYQEHFPYIFSSSVLRWCVCVSNLVIWRWSIVSDNFDTQKQYYLRARAFFAFAAALSLHSAVCAEELGIKSRRMNGSESMDSLRERAINRAPPSTRAAFLFCDFVFLIKSEFMATPARER